MEEIKTKLKTGLNCLTRALSILKLEPDGSFEKDIFEGSQKSLLDLQAFVQTVTEKL